MPAAVGELCHWYVVEVLEPVIAPGTAVSCNPACGVPVIAAEARVGGASRTAEVADAIFESLPPEFVTVIDTFIKLPASPLTGVYVDAVADAMLV